MSILHDDAYYESRKPQADLGPLQNFKRFLWNADKKSFLDRTCEAWAQISFFYLVFFGVIFSLFAVKMWITLTYIYSMNQPYVFVARNLKTSSDDSNRIPLLARTFNEGPGLNFKPNILTPMTSPIIWISNRTGSAEPIKYVKNLNEFFERYNREKLSYTTTCEDRNSVIAVNKEKPCFFNVSTLEQCSKPPYGYTAGEPCVIIAFNKMFHWAPNYYTATSDLPSAMPDWLQNLVRQSTELNVWLSCGGANPVDREHLGKILYLPGPGFPAAFFPYFGHKHHMSPLVAVQFKNVTVNRLLTVECTAWARNIDVINGYSLDFQIMIGKLSFFERCENLCLYSSEKTWIRKKKLRQ